MSRRGSGAWVVWFCSSAAALAALVMSLYPPLRTTWQNEVIRRATEPVGLQPRISAAPPRTLLEASIAGLPVRRSTSDAAELLLANESKDRSPESLHRTGIGLLLLGNAPAAADRLRQAASRGRKAEWWSDLAAAELIAGDERKDPEHNLAALVAANHSITLDRRLRDAHFNKALALEHLGFEELSTESWRNALELEGDSSNGGIIAAHLSEMSTRQTALDRWTDAEHRIAAGTLPRNLEQLIAQHPQQARLFGEELFLARWAKGEGELFLDSTRIIGQRLSKRSGERLLQQAVAEIDSARASGDVRRVADIANGAIAFSAGRSAYRAGDVATARCVHG